MINKIPTLDEKTSHLLTHLFQAHEQVSEVLLYGSRAKGTHHERSDIDLVIRSSEIDWYLLAKIQFEIDNSDIPYVVDLSVLENIKNEGLLAHIRQVGKLVYKR